MKKNWNPDFLDSSKGDELKPLFITARSIEKVIIGISAKTLANWRHQKIGPKYHKVDGSVYYKISELEEYFGQNLIQTSNKK